MKPVVRQEWIESERGWGIRPDGYSLHKDRASLDEYVKEYWKSMPDKVPDEYSRPAGAPTVMDVDEKTYKDVIKGNGVRYYR